PIDEVVELRCRSNPCVAHILGTEPIPDQTKETFAQELSTYVVRPLSLQRSVVLGFEGIWAESHRQVVDHQRNRSVGLRTAVVQSTFQNVDHSGIALQSGHVVRFWMEPPRVVGRQARN